MTRIHYSISLFTLALMTLLSGLCVAQSQLFIPPTIEGRTISLDIQAGEKELIPSVMTPTYGVNGPFLAPTILLTKGDSVTLNVKNSLVGTSTTMHWHGLHLPAKWDGGPMQPIKAGTTWSPSFRVMNDAATYWYHPHGEGKTEFQVSKGLAGLIIVRDSLESSLKLPRQYGVDDIPIILQTKAFDDLYQIAIASELDTLVVINGTVKPFVKLPAQVVRLRLLNGSTMRSYLFGFSNGNDFYQIATDGGLLSKPIKRKQLRLSPGERAEVLIDLSALRDQIIYLKNFGSQLSNGIYGAKTVGMGMAQIPEYSKNPLNGSDFNLVEIRVGNATANAVTVIPTVLHNTLPLRSVDATVTRSFEFTPEKMGMEYMVEGPFLINKKRFSMDTINFVSYKNTTEIWSLKNSTLIAHPFHIHDQQVYILDRDGVDVSALESGKKDVVLVMPNETLRFVTKFSDYSDATSPYMYHCHMLHHEDDGMMGSFAVVDSLTSDVTNESILSCLAPNPADHTLLVNLSSFGMMAPLRIELRDALGHSVQSVSVETGLEVLSLDVRSLCSGFYQCLIHTTDRSWKYPLCIVH